MSVVISGRLKNRAQSGFVRTPPPLAERIKTNLLAFALPSAGQHLTIYDPTCGEGDLLAPFATLRGAQLYGVEISGERAALARSRLPNARILESDVAAISVPKASLSLIVANPPYLQSAVTRLELAILKDAGEGLVAGGVLVAILPARQWDGFMAAHWLRHYDAVRCWKFPDHPDDPDHEEAFERFTQIVVVGVRRAAPRTEIDPAEKQRLRGWRYRTERLAAGQCPWDGGAAPPWLPDAPIADLYRVLVVKSLPDLVVRQADDAQILTTLDEFGVHTTPEWRAATTWPEETMVDRPVMDYTGAAHVAADILTGFLDGLPVTAPDASRYLLTTFVTQEWVSHPLSDEDLEEERKKGAIAVRVEQLEDKAILGVLNLETGDLTYYQKEAVYRFLTDGGWLPTLAMQCRAQREPWYKLDPADWQIRIACRIGQDKQLHGAEFPGLSVAQQHRAYALYASISALGRAAIQGEPGTGKTRILTLLLAQAAERWQQRECAEFRRHRQPAWLRRLKKAWKSNPRTWGKQPNALPILIAMPLRTRKGFRRDCAAAWPEAEFVVIEDHTDIRRWLDRCAVSHAPAVIAIASLSQTKDFGNEWLGAAIEKQRTCQAPDLSPAAQERGEPWMVDGALVGYRDRSSGELIMTAQTTSRFFCPDCGRQVEDTPLTAKEGEDTLEPVTSVTYFIVKRRRCRHCGASLNSKDRIASRRMKWPHVPFAVWSKGVAAQEPWASRRQRQRSQQPALWRIVDEQGNRGPAAPDSICPFEYLYTHYRGCVAITIVDESHNLAGRDSHLARAGHLAMRAAQARVLSSGTHFAGTLDKLFFYWTRFNPQFWRSLGLGWYDLEAAIKRYGVIQHWVREVESVAKRGGRGQTEVRESTIPAPGVSARLLPRLLSELVFLTVLDVGAHMPPRIEIPEIVSMRDPALQERVDAARAALVTAEHQHAAATAALQELQAHPCADDTAVAAARAAVVAAETDLMTTQAALTEAQAWAAARDLDRHYRQAAGLLEAKAKSRDAGSSAARLAQGTIPRWFAALPCAEPAFTVTYSKKGEWGDVEAEHTLITTPVLAWDHVYPLERRLREIVQAERAEGRRVMLYIEQQQRSMAERLSWLLPEFEPWTLPDSVKAENREDAIRQTVQSGHAVVIVPFLRVAEGLNLQDVLDTIIWVELPKNLFTLDQASRRIWRLNKREPVRLYYLAYAGTAGHRKLRKLASMSGAAALFAGQTPDGQLIRSVGAHTTTLARLSADLDAQDDLRAAFAHRDAELAAALAAGRQWIGVTDTLPERLRAIRQQLNASRTVALAPASPPTPDTRQLVQVQMDLTVGSIRDTSSISFGDTAVLAMRRKPTRAKRAPAAGQLTLFEF